MLILLILCTPRERTQLAYVLILYTPKDRTPGVQKVREHASIARSKFSPAGAIFQNRHEFFKHM